jgi:hypothetical protein
MTQTKADSTPTTEKKLHKRLKQFAPDCEICASFFKELQNPNNKTQNKALSHLRSVHKIVQEKYYTNSFMALGIAIGLSYGMLISSFPIGMSLGLGIGLALGSSMDEKARKEKRIL